jgi:hypothetical protein
LTVFIQKNFNYLEEEWRKILLIEEQNEKIEKLNEEQKKYNKPWSWKVFRCVNDKVKIAVYRWDEKFDRKMNEIMKLEWGKKNDVIFKEKEPPSEETRRKQEMVNELNIIKGFPKVVWDYCTFTLEEYTKEKAKLKDCKEM